MNWEMLSAIGQLVAAIGVIPSLVYLAVQIRGQNKERRRSGINISAIVLSLQHYKDMDTTLKTEQRPNLAMQPRIHLGAGLVSR